MTIAGVENKVRKSFSKAAVHYEQLSGLQQAIGLRLLDELKDEKPQRVLDIGMGTGWLTEKISQDFPDAKVAGIDFAEGMLLASRHKKERFQAIGAHAEMLPFSDGSFDLIISNLSYQWVEKLNGAFREAERVLRQNGVFYLSCFGSQSLRELFQCFNDRKSLQKLQLPTREDISSAFSEEAFYDFHITFDIYKVYFPDVLTLLKWLKKTGANVNPQEVVIGKDFLKEIDSVYRRKFSDQGKIYASFEVIWAKAKKSSVFSPQLSV